MRELARIRFGSHLYGTCTPESDLDIKTVFVPDPRDILLGRVQETLSTSRPKDAGEKNRRDDVDIEAHALRRFLQLAAEGQTLPLDMLFATPEHTMVTSPHWEEVIRQRHRLLTRGCASFVAYAQRQASKYGVKGSRVAAVRRALTVLDGGVARLGERVRLLDLLPEAIAASGETEHMRVNHDEATGRAVSWEIVERCFEFTSPAWHVRAALGTLFDSYSQRVLAAERSQGVDWKAVSHAVRVASQALELLTTGHISFPRPERELLVEIKTGRRAYPSVAGTIDDLLDRVREASAASSLPEEADREWIDEFVLEVYGHETLGLFGYLGMKPSGVLYLRSKRPPEKLALTRFTESQAP